MLCTFINVTALATTAICQHSAFRRKSHCRVQHKKPASAIAAVAHPSAPSPHR